MEVLEDSTAKPKIVPLLFKFRQMIDKPMISYRYDEIRGVNIADYNGKEIPEVLLPSTLSRIKTTNKSSGED